MHMSKSPLEEWLLEVANDPITINREDVGSEVGNNLWSFSLCPDEAKTLSPDDVACFAEQVIQARSSQARRQSHSMIIYWWHDELAGQLRFSLISAHHNSLPFKCEITSVTSIHGIAQAWLNSNQGCIPWQDLSETPTTGRVDDEEPYRLNVWSIKIPD